ncbi:hypothetical protein [Campylobacter sp. RM16192]|nr:hypothetical protein [Campylobacter sp. RM16192]
MHLKSYKIYDEKVRVIVNSYGYKTKTMSETTNYKAKVVEI